MEKILTVGVYDYFHLGHLRLFKQAKEYADYLIVAVQDGDYIKMFKPEAKVLYSLEERIEIIQSLRVVDEVTVYQIIGGDFLETVDFDIFAIGEDQIGQRWDDAARWCKEHGKRVVRLNRTQGIASSSIKSEVERVK